MFMRRRLLTWFLVSLICLVAAIVCWRLAGDRRAGKLAHSSRPAQTSQSAATKGATPAKPSAPAPMVLLSQLASANSVQPAPAAMPANPRFPYRLSNTARTVGQLARVDHAILL